MICPNADICVTLPCYHNTSHEYSHHCDVTGRPEICPKCRDEFEEIMKKALKVAKDSENKS